MKINIEEYGISKSLLDFIKDNTKTGNISFILYGENADNWINGKGKVPYIQIEGKMQWNIPLNDVTVFDFAKTFQLNIGNDLNVEFNEVQNCGCFCENLQSQNNVFRKFLKNAIKEWEPKEKNIKIEKIIKYIDHTEVRLDFVLDAIWIRDSYTLEEFMSLFYVTRNEADNILRCVGYEKKKCNQYYFLQIQRKQSIIKCMEKTFEVVDMKENELSVLSRIEKRGFRIIENIGETIAEYGRRKNYYNNPMIEWNEPVYHKREDRLDKIISAILVLGMLAFVLTIVSIFFYQMTSNTSSNNDNLYSFWGSIAGSMVAGLITIFTTHLIIQRSYKIDYHQERIDVLPFFEANIVSNHFSTEREDDIPAEVKDIIKNQICYSTCLMEDAMLIEFRNIGSGPAFQVKIVGLTADYEEPFFQSIVVDKKKYMICYSYEKMKFKIEFYDMYGNYYYQSFISENNVNWDEGYFELNTFPPEIILRTKRTRYVQ